MRVFLVDDEFLQRALVKKTVDWNSLGMEICGEAEDGEEALKKILEEKPDILGLSAMLTTTMPEMAKVVETLKAEGLRDQVKVIIGGAPVTADYAQTIGADGYSADAAEAVELCRRLQNL